MRKDRRRKMMDEFYKEVEEENLLPEMKPISLRYCEESMTYRIKNKWKDYEDINEVLYENVVQTVKNKIDNDVEITVEPIKKGSKIKELLITAKRGKKEQQKRVKAIVDKTMNPSLSKKYSNYLEGTLQLRNVDPEMFEYLQELLEDAEKRYCHVTSIKEKKQAIDIEMTSQKEIGKIAKAMHKQFGGELKLDYKLHTRDKNTQKELFRIAATVILPDVKKGEIINKEGIPYEILAIDKKTLKVYDLDSRKKSTIELWSGYKKLEKYNVAVSQIKPDIRAIDPVNFQPAPVALKDEKNSKKIKMGQKLDVVKSKKKLYSLKK